MADISGVSTYTRGRLVHEDIHYRSLSDSRRPAETATQSVINQNGLHEDKKCALAYVANELTCCALSKYEYLISDF